MSWKLALFGLGVAGEDGLELVDDDWLLGGEVLGFEGIALVVVEFVFATPFDESVALRADGAT